MRRLDGTGAHTSLCDHSETRHDTFGVKEVKTVPYVPLSRPFVERLVGTVRREYLDQMPFWNAQDLERKLDSFQEYYNCNRVHQGLEGQVPDPELAAKTSQQFASMTTAGNLTAAAYFNYQWRLELEFAPHRLCSASGKPISPKKLFHESALRRKPARAGTAKVPSD